MQKKQRRRDTDLERIRLAEKLAQEQTQVNNKLTTDTQMHDGAGRNALHANKNGAKDKAASRKPHGPIENLTLAG